MPTARGLLRAHVSGRAQDRSLDCQRGVIVKSARETEVRQARAARGLNDHVGRLDVAVDHSSTVGMVERVG